MKGIRRSEQTLQQARIGGRKGIAGLTPEEVGKIQRDIARAKRDCKDLRARLRGREIIRAANTFHGHLRLPPSTFYALHQHGKAAHPVLAFWHFE